MHRPAARFLRTHLLGAPALVPALTLASGPAQPVAAQPVPVEVVETDGRYQLLRDGAPYFIQGAGGSGPKDQLAAAGANCFRTWGVGPDLGDQLDEAERLGLTVVVGHWLGHERHGFDYNDVDAVAEQMDRVRRDVLAYKDHPAVLMWGIGNEMEGFGEADNAAVWSHVQAVAAMVKRLDPHHPTMTTTADIGGRRVAAIHALCPDIDIHGINSYGGLPSIPERYRKAGGTKPVVITEFGPPGTWETGKTDFGAPKELTSTQKAGVYRDAYTRGCLEAEGLCLGGFAFTWGFKMEATQTWFGMLLPNGDKTAAVDAMTELWSGAPPENLCPEIRAFGVRSGGTLQPSATIAPGETVEVALDIADPEGAPVAVQWEVRGEAAEYLTGGDAQAVPLALDGVITESSPTGATLQIPGGGIYRVYMTATDGTGGGAVANLPIKVDGPPQPVRLKLPLAVYADREPAPWAPSGWMGAHEDLEMDEECRVSPRSGDTCLKFTYANPGRWVGVVWQHPVNDWGDLPGGFDLTGAEKLTFWARSEQGGEKVDFGVGIIEEGKPHPDTLKSEKKGVKLGTEWKQYTIKLGGKDLSQVKSAFWWSLGGHGREVTLYLDDIRFE
ncbi:MAG: hypothetical protein HKN12_06245 [Gemmatimonadetes bacterium]|nr:hypothetical protein [Gemmatimonadota bacterium]